MTLRVLALLSLVSLSASAQQIALKQIASGLSSPVAITHANDNRLFITLQPGQIRIFDGTRLLDRPFLDIQSLVRFGGEQGLLSVAFHPRYSENGFFYVYYVNRSRDLIVARYRVTPADPNVADTSSAKVLLTIPHRDFDNHNGGQLQFGPDGYLYIGTGDGGGGGDPLRNGQTLTALLGKMLRIDVDSGDPYAIPPGNPFANQNNARGEVWASGMRNPWRFSFDRNNGELWIADVGQGAWEEVNLQPATSTGGENYGWNRMEGKHCFQTSNCDRAGLTLPVIEYDHSDNACSITGGYRYRGAKFPRLQGLYIYGDYCSGGIFAALQRGETWSTQPLFSARFFISTFGEDAAGELYVANYFGGIVYQIVDNATFPSKRRIVAPH